MLWNIRVNPVMGKDTWTAHDATVKGVTSARAAESLRVGLARAVVKSIGNDERQTILRFRVSEPTGSVA